MNSTTMQGLATRVNDLIADGITSEMDFVHVAGLFARMAALGDDSVLHIWQSIFNNSSLPPLDEIFRKRAKAGVFDLHEMLGERLALAIVEAQDAYCFLQTEEPRLPKDAIQAIKYWCDESDLVSLDTESAAFLREWLEAYPLPENFRLRNLIAPKSKAEWQMLGKCSPRRHSKSVTLGEDGKIETADGAIYVTENRTADRREINVTDADSQPVFVRRLRAGFLPAVQEKSGKWVLHLEGFPLETRDKMLSEPLEFTLLRGQKLVVQSRANVLDVRHQREVAWNTNRSQVPTAMFACDDGKQSPYPAGPPAHWVPVIGVRVGADNNHGTLGFLSVDAVPKPKFGQPRDTGDNDELRKYAYNAAEFVFHLFRELDHDLGSPAIDLRFPPGDGSSLSLPAMMAALARILGITWRDDVIATGCFDASSGKLTPVAADTLPQKIEVALRFGYKKLVVVEGQNVPENAGIEIVFVSTDPLIALFDLLKLAKNENESESRVARLLAVFANRKIRSMSFQEIEKIVANFCDSSSRLVKHVACDILSRSALHEGKTADAEKYATDAGQLNWHEVPTDWLGHYIRYEETASRAEVAIDGGTWDRTHDAHRELNQRLGTLKTAKRRGCAGADDLFAMLALYNTRAQRKQFLARMAQDKRALRRAWNDFFYLFDEWDDLFLHCARLGRADSNFERQRNYCLSALADARRLGKSLVPYGGASYTLELIERRGEFVRKSGYDRSAWLDWNFVIDKTPSETEIDTLLAEANAAYAGWKNYPNFLVYEKLLRYGYGTETQRSHCVEQLAQAAHLDSELPPTSILTLLALRTRAVLAQNGKTLNTKPVLPNAATPLRIIADDLLSDETTLINRTPY